MAAEEKGDEQLFQLDNLLDDVVKPSVCARYTETNIHNNLKYYLFSKTAVDSLVESIKNQELPFYNVVQDPATGLFLSTPSPPIIPPLQVTSENMYATTLISFHVHFLSETNIRIHLIPTIENPFSYVQNPFASLLPQDITEPNGRVHVFIRKLVHEIYAISRIKPFVIGQMFTVSYDIMFNRRVDNRGGDFHRDNSKYGTNFDFLTLEYFMDQHVECLTAELIAGYTFVEGGTIIPDADVKRFLQGADGRRDMRLVSQDGTTICFDNLFCIHATPLINKKVQTNPDGSTQSTYPFPHYFETTKTVQNADGSTSVVPAIIHHRADARITEFELEKSSRPTGMSQSPPASQELIEGVPDIDLPDIGATLREDTYEGFAHAEASEENETSYFNTATEDTNAAKAHARPIIAIPPGQAPVPPVYNQVKRSHLVEEASMDELKTIVENTRFIRRSFLRGSWKLTTSTIDEIIVASPLDRPAAAGSKAIYDEIVAAIATVVAQSTTMADVLRQSQGAVEPDIPTLKRAVSSAVRKGASDIAYLLLPIIRGKHPIDVAMSIVGGGGGGTDRELKQCIIGTKTVSSVVETIFNNAATTCIARVDATVAEGEGEISSNDVGKAYLFAVNIIADMVNRAAADSGRAVSVRIVEIPNELVLIPQIVFRPLDETRDILGGAGAGSRPASSYKTTEGFVPKVPNLLIQNDNLLLLCPYDMFQLTKKGLSVCLEQEKEFIKNIKAKRGGRKHKKSNKRKKTKKRSKKQTRKRFN